MNEPSEDVSDRGGDLLPHPPLLVMFTDASRTPMTFFVTAFLFHLAMLAFKEAVLNIECPANLNDLLNNISPLCFRHFFYKDTSLNNYVLLHSPNS